MKPLIYCWGTKWAEQVRHFMLPGQQGCRWDCAVHHLLKEAKSCRRAEGSHSKECSEAALPLHKATLPLTWTTAESSIKCPSKQLGQGGQNVTTPPLMLYALVIPHSPRTDNNGTLSTGLGKGSFGTCNQCHVASGYKGWNCMYLSCLAGHSSSQMQDSPTTKYLAKTHIP